MHANPRPKPLARLRQSAAQADLARRIALALALQRFVDAEVRRQCAQLHAQERDKPAN